MLTGERNGWHETRPQLWRAKEGFEAPPQLGAFGAASLLPKRQMRIEAMRVLLPALSSDLSHPEWSQVLAYFGAFRDLPAPALDLFAAMASDRDALASFAFMVAAEEEMLREFLSFVERLPFAWFLVPVRTWVRALSSFRAACERTLPTEIVAEISTRAIGVLACEGSTKAPGFETTFGAARALSNASATWPASILANGEAGASGRYFNDCQRLEHETRSGSRTFPVWHGLKPVYDRIVAETRWTGEVFPWKQYEHQGRLRETVVNAPRVAALCVATGVSLTEMEAVHLRRVRSFSESDFDALFELHLPRAIFEAERRKPGLLR